ncbi:bifunctional diaminohydroxyphosphoribosylaminopyrimidine deaminase/5-amino-6-(5-phosphoribosylamino)uracil reductase RibD [Marivita sp. GX14005]|uniref:bifunctional diaminohydroxyphosphoribosylaminopyrimidine deaminase/5-amino-6-(5-phosphoribosylamino)uracil reductase RibD n=1 Tax=Marivita sp. GX14005 TaxID=2942276 RepID=UPI002019ECE6|nr:bifunctional diaminohydroxyphosphoribosylaminopyrimidine deaminase/5-amino-6-(5-phosphoribosylamino)uracil reductase RibD [Marivita sp. GX14005]MCL3881162.1 bifunctional diaminohydroxyphosphoribosylaminopyrimidine deaminase/5-amino-6-(5-phosphoribosylamino)uracil reductase RibD [Marivita sp. GX14005]
MPAADDAFMERALALGRRGMGNTWPNPAVGCVLVKRGQIIGEGWTQPGGRPHAETEALAKAGARAQGATAYVTLEPCAHHGRTPPCADALIAAGVARVVAPFDDRDPRVSGQGFARLRGAGVEVVTGIGHDAAEEHHAGFFTRVTLGRPLVTLKLATSLDGRIATASGDSQWITGPDARAHVHELRATHDAVMVGGGTARADDPTLTVRGREVVRQPVRIVVSRKLDLPAQTNLSRTMDIAPLWLCHGEDVPADRKDAWATSGVELVPVAQTGQRLDPGAMLQALGARGLTRVFCEGGGELASSLLSADLVDRLELHVGGVVVGAEGRPALGALGLERLSDAPRFTLRDLRRIGNDVVQSWTRQRHAQE